MRSSVAAGCIAAGLLSVACGGGGGGEGGAQVQNSPVARLSLSPRSGPAPLAISYNGAASTDPDGAPLTFQWEFGNGQTSAASTGTVTYPDSGTYTVRLTVTNPAGLTGTQQATVTVGGTLLESEAHRVLYLTNLERGTHGVPPLKGQSSLESAAQAHADDMAQRDYFSHNSQDGRTPGSRITAAGYIWNAYGENIAAGQGTPEAVMETWKNSSGHHANLINATFRELGVGYSLRSGSTYGTYWVQDFGARPGVYPVVIENEAFSTTSRTVNLYLYGTGWASQMMISEDPGFTGANWVPFSAAAQIQLSEGTGLKHVHARIKNGAGEVKTATDEIVLQ